jgi:hypothetical protein
MHQGYAMIMAHRKDASNSFKQALQAFGVTWERKTKAPEKVPAKTVGNPNAPGRKAGGVVARKTLREFLRRISA